MKTETFFEYQNMQDGKTGKGTHKKFVQKFFRIKGILKGLEKLLEYHKILEGINKVFATKKKYYENK